MAANWVDILTREAIFLTKDEYKEMIEEKNKIETYALDLERQLEAKQKSNLEQFLSDYRYAILVDREHYTTYWNDGRAEMGVRYIEFSAEPCRIPELHITK